MHRRTFLEVLGALPVTRLAAAVVPAPKLTYPTKPRERVAVASYPFRSMVNPKNGRMPLTDFPGFVKARFQVSGIELLGQHFASTSLDYLKTLKDAIAKAGCHVVNIPTSVKTSFYDADPGNRQQAVSAAKEWIDVAVTLQSPSVRINLRGVRGLEPNVDLTVQGLKELAAYGQEKQIIVNLENDAPIYENAFFLVKVIEGVNSSYLRALPDFCNSMIEESANQAYNDRALKALYPLAANISHVKDSEVGKGTLYQVDINRCFEIAKQSGYRGYFSMEFEGQGDPVTGTAKLIDTTLAHI